MSRKSIAAWLRPAASQLSRLSAPSLQHTVLGGRASACEGVGAAGKCCVIHSLLFFSFCFAGHKGNCSVT